MHNITNRKIIFVIFSKYLLNWNLVYFDELILLVGQRFFRSALYFRTFYIELKLDEYSEDRCSNFDSVTTMTTLFKVPFCYDRIGAFKKKKIFFIFLFLFHIKFK